MRVSTSLRQSTVWYLTCYRITSHMLPYDLSHVTVWYLTCYRIISHMLPYNIFGRWDEWVPRSRLRWAVESNEVVQIRANDVVELWCCGANVSHITHPSCLICLKQMSSYQAVTALYMTLKSQLMLILMLMLMDSGPWCLAWIKSSESSWWSVLCGSSSFNRISMGRPIQTQTCEACYCHESRFFNRVGVAQWWGTFSQSFNGSCVEFFSCEETQRISFTFKIGQSDSVWHHVE